MNQPATIPLSAPPTGETQSTKAVAAVRIGHIVSVSGPRAVAILERSTDITLRHKDPRIQVGGVVRIQTPGTSTIGLISAISAPMPEMGGGKEDVGLIEINLVGQIGTRDEDRKPCFVRGVSSLPSLSDAVFVASREELTLMFSLQDAHSIKVGTLFQDSTIPARLLTDELLSKHFIVVGSTGSGKSCALTCIVQQMLTGRESAHVVILDIHNEYHAAFGDLVEHITLDNFNLPIWMLNFNELCVALTSDNASRDDEIEILGDGILFAKRRYSDAAAGRAGLLARKPADSAPITVNTPTPFRMSDVTSYIDSELGKLERARATGPYRRLKTRIETLVADPQYNFMFGSLSIQDTMTDVLSRLFRIPNGGRPISVIDLSTVPHEILDVIVSVIARLAFDLAVWSEGKLPLQIICEEAHRYAPVNGSDKFLPTRKSLGRIAKEGRKYGISLGLVTQRPSELDSTILSQCGTAIVLRLTSEKDQDVIRGSTYEGMADLIDFLPMLGDREALVLGQGTSMPMRIRIDNVGRRGLPKNLNNSFSQSTKWKSMNRDELDGIVTRWRTTGK